MKKAPELLLGRFHFLLFVRVRFALLVLALFVGLAPEHLGRIAVPVPALVLASGFVFELVRIHHECSGLDGYARMVRVLA